MTHRCRAFAPLLCLALAGCGPGGGVNLNQAANAGPASSAFQATAPAPRASGAGVYKVSAGDVIEVSVFQVPDLSRTVEVDGSGNVNLPLIGATPAMGKTVRELEADIARRLGARYLQSPQVAVFVKDAVGQRVTVDGAVKKPGVITARGDMTLLRALAEAQGFSDTADYSAIMVFRNTQTGRQVARFDANAIRSGQMPDPPIYGGDTIVVDDSTGKLAWKQFREALPVAGLFRVF